MKFSGIDLLAAGCVTLRADASCLDGAQHGGAVDAGGRGGAHEVVRGLLLHVATDMEATLREVVNERLSQTMFRASKDDLLSISIPRNEAGVIRHFQERMPYGLSVLDDPSAVPWPLR